MNPFNFLSGLISPITKYLSTRQKIKDAKVQRKDELVKLKLKSKLESIAKGENLDIDLDATSRSNAGWMDDVSFFVFLSPAVLAFFPSMLPHVTAGFIALQQMPQWYQAALGMMLVSVWGYRKLVSPIIQSIAKAYLGKAKL